MYGRAGFRGQVRAGMLNEFLTWWTQQLLSLVPVALRQRGAGRGDAVIVGVAGSLAAVDLVVRRRGKEGALGRFPVTDAGAAGMRTALGTSGDGRGAAELRLAPGMVLEQAVMLPLAAERDLVRVLQYEMDRLTPFRADDLFWTSRVERRDRARGQVHVRLFLTPRAPLVPVLQVLRLAGVRPGVVRGGNGPADVSMALEREPAGAWRGRVVAGLAVVCALLAVAVVAAPFWRQSREAHAVERRIAFLRPAVDQAEGLRRQLAAAAAGVDVLAAQRAQSGDALEMLATVTGTLPDDTVLSDLAFHGRGIVMSGQSAAAARLIGALAADPALRNPSFAAPVTRNDTTGTEGFSIRAEMAP